LLDPRGVISKIGSRKEGASSGLVSQERGGVQYFHTAPRKGAEVRTIKWESRSKKKWRGRGTTVRPAKSLIIIELKKQNRSGPTSKEKRHISTGARGEWMFVRITWDKPDDHVTVENVRRRRPPVKTLRNKASEQRPNSFMSQTVSVDGEVRDNSTRGGGGILTSVTLLLIKRSRRRCERSRTRTKRKQRFIAGEKTELKTGSQRWSRNAHSDG